MHDKQRYKFVRHDVMLISLWTLDCMRWVATSSARYTEAIGMLQVLIRSLLCHSQQAAGRLTTTLLTNSARHAGELPSRGRHALLQHGGRSEGDGSQRRSHRDAARAELPAAECAAAIQLRRHAVLAPVELLLLQVGTRGTAAMGALILAAACVRCSSHVQDGSGQAACVPASEFLLRRASSIQFPFGLSLALHAGVGARLAVGGMGVRPAACQPLRHTERPCRMTYGALATFHKPPTCKNTAVWQIRRAHTGRKTHFDLFLWNMDRGLRRPHPGQCLSASAARCSAMPPKPAAKAGKCGCSAGSRPPKCRLMILRAC